MKKIIIYGTVYLDVIKLIDAINSKEKEWEVLGFIDDNKNNYGKNFMNYPVLGGKEVILELINDENLYFFVNRHDELSSFSRKVRLLESYNCNIPSLIHPEVDLNYVKVGKGCIIPSGCIIGVNVEIGNYVTMRDKSMINHDTKIEDYVFIAPGTIIGSEVTLKEGSFAGIGSTVLPKITVGKRSYIGGGSVVTRNVKEKNTVVGVPARKLKKSLYRKIRFHIKQKFPFNLIFNDNLITTQSLSIK